MITKLDPLCELDLLSGGQQRHLANVFQKELQGVGRDLRLGAPILVGIGVDLLGRDDVDLSLLEGGIELVELGRVEVELVKGERDLLRVELAGPTAGIKQRPDLEQVEDARCGGGRRRATLVSCAQNTPLSVEPP